MDKITKETIKSALKKKLMGGNIKKVVLFGSFLHEDNPHDIDIAIFDDSGKDYLKLALEYRKAIRDLNLNLPVDLIPIKYGYKKGGMFLKEIDKGEVIYER